VKKLSIDSGTVACIKMFQDSITCCTFLTLPLPGRQKVAETKTGLSLNLHAAPLLKRKKLSCRAILENTANHVRTEQQRTERWHLLMMVVTARPDHCLHGQCHCLQQALPRGVSPATTSVERYLQEQQCVEILDGDDRTF
jgi:hypothetical protein